MIGRQITKIGRQIEKQVTEKKKRGWEGGGEKRRNGERKKIYKFDNRFIFGLRIIHACLLCLEVYF